MAAVHSAKQPDVMKVFEAIAMIISRRGEGNVRLVSVRKTSGNDRKAG